jgi:hypothetical protein
MITKILKNISLSILIASFAFIATSFGFRASRVDAANYFGGMKIMSLMCTCSGNQLIYIQNYSSNGGGMLALIYDGSGRLFSNNNIYGTYLLGSYSSGGECQMISYPECYTINSDGKFDSNPGTGTS